MTNAPNVYDFSDEHLSHASHILSENYQEIILDLLKKTFTLTEIDVIANCAYKFNQDMSDFESSLEFLASCAIFMIKEKKGRSRLCIFNGLKNCICKKNFYKPPCLEQELHLYILNSPRFQLEGCQLEANQ